ncbi:hypothetical protein AMJ40_00545 [candidate division TA06 bacterium DG_26]|uniref:Riboflavin synthase n=1 Tax=candidate division TA06 bacterium DG_26 TaxID=1703771 RepID=A0A0S7WM32_UNCT6|nr:MAG: hypothetical protein AMJ40_00545 [candidate division TA06 bacterium DG_26]
MFTGLVEEVGKVERKTRRSGMLALTLQGRKVLQDLSAGASIAVNGACLTVTEVNQTRFSVDVSEETQKSTTLSSLKVGEAVNLERAMRREDRLGGHILSGHIDGVARITGRRRLSESTVYEIELRPEFAPYVVEKGSVALDGVSLTVSQLRGNSFSVHIIPYTEQATTFRYKKVGDRVNIELDMIGKYVVHFLRSMRRFKE